MNPKRILKNGSSLFLFISSSCIPCIECYQSFCILRFACYFFLIHIKINWNFQIYPSSKEKDVFVLLKDQFQLFSRFSLLFYQYTVVGCFFLLVSNTNDDKTAVKIITILFCTWSLGRYFTMTTRFIKGPVAIPIVY